MPDILIRDLPEDVVAAIDSTAKRLGLSRNEYLRRELGARAHAAQPPRTVTVEDLRQLSALISDLNDPEVMAGAWD